MVKNTSIQWGLYDNRSIKRWYLYTGGYLPFLEGIIFEPATQQPCRLLAINNAPAPALRCCLVGYSTGYPWTTKTWECPQQQWYPLLPLKFFVHQVFTKHFVAKFALGFNQSKSWRSHMEPQLSRCIIRATSKSTEFTLRGFTGLHRDNHSGEWLTNG